MTLSHSAGTIEPLETRIAPAVIFVGATGLNDSEYSEPPGALGTEQDPGFGNPFVNTETPGDPISAVVGPGVVASPDTFYLTLKTGDSVLRFDGNGYTPFITGLGGIDGNADPIGITGNVVAFFVDKNLNNEVDANELTGLSLGENASVQVTGDVDGDILSNFNDDTSNLGRAGAGEPAGVAKDLLLNPIKALVVDGNVIGDVVSGGLISRLNIVGSVERVLTGAAGHNVTYDFLDGAGADGGDTLVVTPAIGVKGVSMTNISIGDIGVKVEAGRGGAAAEGGSITNLTVISDTTGFQVLAGAGGDGVAGKIAGGLGGKLNKIYVNGLDENEADPSANSVIEIRAGNGGDGLDATASKGGAGGAASEIYVGFELQGNKLQASTNALRDTVLVTSGIGGDGKTGNVGGKLSTVNVIAAPTADTNDIRIISGDGGANDVLLKGGKAGAGGAISTIDVLNPGNSAASQLSEIVVRAGDGGTTTAMGAGGAGGAVTGAKLVGFMINVEAGNGSTGTAGAAGGAIKTILVDEGFGGVRAESIILNGGSGGSGNVTKGFAAGSVSDITVNNADLTVFEINQAGFGNGGSSTKGTGAAGGGVSDVKVVDIDSGAGNLVMMNLRAGNGGNGGGGAGGNGGSFTGDNTIFAVNAQLALNAGIGGNAGGKGNGGKGGDVNALGFFGTIPVGGVAQTVTVNGGNGGNGADKGAGGAGGFLRDFSLNTDGALTATAGAGGMAGAAGAAGAGGAISIASTLSRASSVTITAGDAGTGGVKAGVGGAISNASVRAQTAVTVEAGDSRNGGLGGKIDGLSFTDELGTISAPGVIPGPSGAVTITAGAGSGILKSAGAGGSINDVSGVISSGALTLFRAGVGGGSDSTAAAGGSITDINLFGGGGAGAELRIEAGDATDVANAKKGGAGGSVKEVFVGNPFNRVALDFANTIIRQVVAGDGSDVTIAKGVGGVGGSVQDIRVADDIGVRSGSPFGYNPLAVFTSMGGIFAGAAGTSGAGGKAALAGSVIGISADSIASIVAGKPVNGDIIARRNLAEVVDALVLNGNIASNTNADGSYNNFPVANLVGGVVNPGLAGANTFDVGVNFADTGAGNVGVFGFGDTTTANTDGFVAAVKFTNDLNTPNSIKVEALLTVDPLAPLVSVFIDLNNTNGQA